MVEARDERLIEPRHPVEGHELPTVDVPRQLEIHVASPRVAQCLRLMGEQDDRARGVPPFQRPGHVLPVMGEHARAAGVVDPGEIEYTPHVDALVPQHADAQRRKVRDPLVGARVVLVVAGDEEHADESRDRSAQSQAGNG